jgi:hypothetical protein
MPGLNLKTELQLYKQRLEEIISEINYQNTRIILKQILFASQDLIIYHVGYISNLLEEIEDSNTLTSIQQEKAKRLLEPFQGLEKIEKMLKQIKTDQMLEQENLRWRINN